MSGTSHCGGGAETWSVVLRDQEAVVAALGQGEDPLADAGRRVHRWAAREARREEILEALRYCEG